MNGPNGRWDEGIPLPVDPGDARLSGETILCFGWIDWVTHSQTWNQVLERLAYRNRVVFVPPPLERTEVLGGRFTDKLRAGGLRHVQDHLYVYHFPRYLPTFYKPAWFVRWIEGRRIASLRRALRRIGAGRPVLYLLHPKFRRYVGEFDEKLVVYHVLDEYSGYLGANREMLRTEEGALLDRADLVLCASKLLETSKKGPGRAVYFVPNGVDFDHFARDLGPGPKPPRDIRGIPGPRIGYIGRICDKLDYRLLIEIARSMPEHSFCFAGPAMVLQRQNRALFDEWADLPNVYLLGNKRPDELPAYLRSVDVAILPYLVTEDSKQRYPLKLHEYLAAGKPVVSVPLPCLDEFSDHVRIAGEGATWKEAVRLSLDTACESRRGDRLEVARRHDWNRIVLRIERLIEQAARAASVAGGVR